MQQVPKIVRERLGLESPLGAHPDADLLTAYAEKALPEHKRSAVVKHLARCGECRDVLALALPETEAQRVVVRTRGSWFTWPALRWGLAAAGIIAIVSLGVVQYQHHSAQTATVAKTVPSTGVLRAEVPSSSAETKPSPATATPGPIADSVGRNEDKTRIVAQQAAPNLPSARLASPKEDGGDTSSRKRVFAPVQAPRASGSVGVGTGFTSARVGGPNMPSQWQQQQTSQIQTSNANLEAAAPVLTTPGTKRGAVGVVGGVGGGVQPALPSTQQEVVQVQSADAQVQTETQDAGNQISLDRYSLSKAKPAASAQAAPAPAPMNPAYGANMQMVMMNAGPLPRWNISSSGGLQRSFDQGSSWQDVDVTASSAPTKLARAETASAALANKNYENALALKALPARPVFRAVSANGADVWAGGVNGVLYHSADAGSHWSRVLPIPGVPTVGGDVVAVDFSDPQHGKISTSTGETWTTADGGQTWLKQ